MTVMVAALSSCSKNEVFQNEAENNAVTFGLYSSNATKGAETTTTSIQTGNGFGVFGSFLDNGTPTTTPNFMYNQQVTYTGGVWGYSPIKYYSNDANDRYSFYGYAPYEDGTVIDVTSSNTVAPAITYTLNPADLASTVDFVAGQVVSTPKVSAGNTVNINLKHQLTRIDITAKTDIVDATADGNTSVIIKSINFINGTTTKLHSSAVYSFGSITTDVEETVHTQDGTWGSFTESTANLNFSTLLSDTKNAAIGTYPANKGIEIGDDEAETQLFKANNYAFLIPPAGQTGLADGSDLTLVIEYDIVTADAKLNGGHTFSSNKATFTLSSGNLLAQGKAYNFGLTFTLQGVKLEATVQAWDNAGDITATVTHEADVETI